MDVSAPRANGGASSRFSGRDMGCSAQNKMYTGNIKRLVCAVGRGRGWWGRAREIFIKIEHRLLKSGLGLTLLSLPCCFSVVLGSMWPVPGRLGGKLIPPQGRVPGHLSESPQGTKVTF